MRKPTAPVRLRYSADRPTCSTKLRQQVRPGRSPSPSKVRFASSFPRSSHSARLCRPLHLLYRVARDRVDVLALVNKAVALVEADRARIIRIDEQRDRTGRKPFCLVDQHRRKLRTPMIRRDHELVEIALLVDSHKSLESVLLLRDDDRRIRHQFTTPALAPPWQAGGEID